MSEGIDRILASLSSADHVGGMTHNYYRYPARFSPQLAHDVIELFSDPGDLVADPMMGGGTVVVEALAMGRRVLGVDINPLSRFLGSVKTTPLSGPAADALGDWLQTSQAANGSIPRRNSRGDTLDALPEPTRRFVRRTLKEVETIAGRPAREFARCAVLRVAQSEVDCADGTRPESQLYLRLSRAVNEMLVGMDEFVATCATAGTGRRDIPKRRILLARSSVGLDLDPLVRDAAGRIGLILTSPPYPGAHVLYHRWQVRGRKETGAPYSICGLEDGNTAKYYTFAGRSSSSMAEYVQTLSAIFGSVGRLLSRDALIVQLVGFPRGRSQMMQFLGAMEHAGFSEVFPLTRERRRLWRGVPNRKWYTRGRAETSACKEVLLFHQPATFRMPIP